MTPNQNIAQTLYRKLLGLYPRAFRQRVGESMQQTFVDLYNERKRQAKPGLFGFVLWVFAETAIGIAKEHLVAVAEVRPMKHMLANLRLPATISLMLLVPFVLLEFIFVIVNRLDTFSLRNAIDLVVVFGFLWLGLTAILLILQPFARVMRAGSNGAAKPEQTPAGARRHLLSSPKSAALLSIVLALPFVTILSFLVLGVEPPLGPFAPLLNNPDPDQPDVLGSLIVLGAFLLLVAACIIAREPIARTMRAGGSVFAHPTNLLLAVAILLLIGTAVGGIIVDQFPCWVGVPNCD